MQVILTIVLMIIGFVGGVYTSDNSTLMDCMRVGATRLNGSTVSCDAPRPPKPIPGQVVQPDPGVKDATTKMMDFMLRKIEDMDQADKAKRGEQQQPQRQIEIQVLQVPAQAQNPPQKAAVPPQNETSQQVPSGNPIKQEKPKLLDSEDYESPIKSRSKNEVPSTPAST